MELIRRSAAVEAAKNAAGDIVEDYFTAGVYEASEAVKKVPAVDAVDREKLLKRLFPLGIPRTREDWNYSINARAVYAAIMKE